MAVEQLLKEAQAAAQAGRMRDAEESCRAALRAEPTNVQAMFLLGTVLANTDRTAEALVIFEEILASNPNSIDVNNWLARLLRNSEKFDESIEASMRAIGLNPESAPSHFNLGVTYLSQEHPEKAIDSFEQALEIRPNVAMYHHHQALAAVQLGMDAVAEKGFRAAIALAPDSWQSLLALGELRSKAGEWVEVERLASQALQINHESIQALLMRGASLMATSRIDEAIGEFKRALALDPNSVDALNWLAIGFRNVGNFEESGEHALRATKIEPNSALAQFNAGIIYLIRGEADRSMPFFEVAIQLQPEDPNHHYHYGIAAERLGNLTLAKQAYEIALSHDPRYLPSLLALAELAKKVLDWDEVWKLSNAAITAEPRSVQALLLRSAALLFLSKVDEARADIREAMKLDPKSLLAFEGLAATYESEGRFDEAIAVLRDGLSAIPESGSLFAQFVESKKVTSGDIELVERMAKVSAVGKGEPESLAHLGFALGKAFNDLGDYGMAMANYDEAHKLRKVIERADFSRDLFAAERDQVISIFNQDFFQRHRGMANPSELPIFIVGMMRSGTTLMEQILSSHPDIAAAGEQYLWQEQGRYAGDIERKELIPEKVEELTAQYLRILSNFAEGEPRVTDKFPDNFQNLGLLHTVFPNARIIHMKRHPVDTCLSIYMIRNSKLSWSHDKGDLAFVFKEYLRLAGHWRAVLPKDRYIEVRYEDIVADREPILRQLLPFCGLEWDDRCMAHEENERVVLTPSLWQVRQPIYKTSVERWRKYEPWLGDLKELLDLDPAQV